MQIQSLACSQNSKEAWGTGEEGAREREGAEVREEGGRKRVQIITALVNPDEAFGSYSESDGKPGW